MVCLPQVFPRTKIDIATCCSISSESSDKIYEYVQKLFGGPWRIMGRSSFCPSSYAINSTELAYTPIEGSPFVESTFDRTCRNHVHMYAHHKHWANKYGLKIRDLIKIRSDRCLYLCLYGLDTCFPAFIRYLFSSLCFPA